LRVLVAGHEGLTPVAAQRGDVRDIGMGSLVGIDTVIHLAAALPSGIAGLTTSLADNRPNTPGGWHA
jgi:hypothetical protein